MNNNTVTVYICYLDMESDIPTAYTLSKEVADTIKALDPGAADYLTVTMTPQQWEHIAVTGFLNDPMKSSGLTILP